MGGIVNMRVNVHADNTSERFAAARKDVGDRLRHALKTAGEEVALPAAQAAAWSFAKPMLLVKSGARSSFAASTGLAYVTPGRGKSKLKRAVGLLEFGGTVKKELVPKKKRALTVGHDGSAPVRARVKKPRHYHESLRLTKAVQAKVPATEDVINREMMKAFRGLDHHP